MKPIKLLALFLAALLLLSGCGGGGTLIPGETEDETKTAAVTEQETTEETEPTGLQSVWSPMKEAPDYTLPAGASPDEIRAMAVKAMHDEISVQWFVEKSFSYDNKNGQKMPVNAGEVYAGLPYTQSATGLFQWLQYYDTATGKMAPSISGDLQQWLGNSCAASVIWGWYSVAATTGGNATFTMTPTRGYLPVGGYQLDPSVSSYKDYNTEQIVADNGSQAMLKAYAAVQTADAVVSYKSDGEISGHAQMAIEPAHVVYKDGAIDPDNSYLLVQDQHKGQTKNTEPFVTELDGNRVHYAGHVELKMTFAELLKACYIPLTCAEFTGAKPYTVPTVTAAGAEDVQSPDDLKTLTVSSPYTIAVIRARVLDGEEVLVESKKMMGSTDLYNDTAKVYDMKGFAPPSLARKGEKGKTYRLTLEVILASGSVFTPVDTQFVYNG